MKLSAPKMVTFIICIVAFLVGIFAPTLGIGVAKDYLLYGSFVLLAISCLLKGI